MKLMSGIRTMYANRIACVREGSKVSDIGVRSKAKMYLSYTLGFSRFT